MLVERIASELLVSRGNKELVSAHTESAPSNSATSLAAFFLDKGTKESKWINHQTNNGPNNA